MVRLYILAGGHTLTQLGRVEICIECGALSVGTKMILMLSALNWDSILQVLCKIKKSSRRVDCNI